MKKVMRVKPSLGRFLVLMCAVNFLRSLKVLWKVLWKKLRLRVRDYDSDNLLTLPYSTHAELTGVPKSYLSGYCSLDLATELLHNVGMYKETFGCKSVKFHVLDIFAAGNVFKYHLVGKEFGENCGYKHRP